MRRWWEDAGGLVVELVTRGATRCGRCGALIIHRDVRLHLEWHRALGDAP